MEAIKQFFEKNDKFADYVGIKLLDVSTGNAKAKMEIKNHHLNGVNTVHGAAIFTLADLVFAVASNSHGTIAMGINVSISYLKAISEGILYAEAKEILAKIEPPTKEEEVAPPPEEVAEAEEVPEGEVPAEGERPAEEKKEAPVEEREAPPEPGKTEEEAVKKEKGK